MGFPYAHPFEVFHFTGHQDLSAGAKWFTSILPRAAEELVVGH